MAPGLQEGSQQSTRKSARIGHTETKLERNKMSDTGIENLLREDRLFPPSSSFSAEAVGTKDLYDEAEDDFVAYWTRQAKERITWFKEPTEGLDDSNAPFFT